MVIVGYQWVFQPVKLLETHASALLSLKKECKFRMRKQDWLPWSLNLTTLPLSCLKNFTGSLLKNESPQAAFLSPLKLCRMVKHHHTSVNSSNIYQPSRSLRSSSLKYMYLSVSKCNTAFYGYRAFSVASAKLWNSLPYDLRFFENTNILKLASKPSFLRERLIYFSLMFLS